MDAVEYFEKKKMMTKTCNINCTNCPMSFENNETSEDCGYLEMLYPGKAVEIMEKWSKEHPLKTYATDFFGKLPGARENAQGVPMPCVAYMYGESERSESCDYGTNPCTCADCWNRPMPEVME